MAAELSSSLRAEFNLITERFLFDESLRDRALLIFDELRRHRSSGALRASESSGGFDEALILRVSAYIATRVSGSRDLGMAQFIRDTPWGLEGFAGALKEAAELLDLEVGAREDLRGVTGRFGYLNSLFGKFEQVWRSLEPQAGGNETYYRTTAWLLFALAQRSLGSERVAESLALLASSLAHVFGDSELKARRLVQPSGRISESRMFEEICAVLGLRPDSEREFLLAEFQRLRQGLEDKCVLRPPWKTSARIEVTSKRLELFYQQQIKIDEVDARVFLQARVNFSASIFTPFQKQEFGLRHKPLLRDNKIPCQKILKFDLVPSNPPEAPPEPKSTLGAQTPLVFAKMIRSPFISKASASPISAAMELHNWLVDKTQSLPLYVEGKFVVSHSKRFDSLAERLLGCLDANSFQNITKNILENSVERVVEEEIRITGIRNDEKIDRVTHDRKFKIINLYFWALNSYLVRAQTESGLALDHPSLRSPELHKALLVYCVETVLFVLNIPHFEFAKILDIVDIEPYQAYRKNLSEINFEQFLPTSLKRHFLNIENVIVSQLLWLPGSPYLAKIEGTPEEKLVMDRVLLYSSAQIAALERSTGINDEQAELVWSLVKKIVNERRAILENRFLDQLVMCSFYVVCKLLKVNLRFQEIISKYQRISTFSKTKFQNVVYSCQIAKNSFENIITFYNKVFVPQLSAEILVIKEQCVKSLQIARTKSIEIIQKPQIRPKSDFNVDVLRSPLKALAVTPFTYYQKTPLNYKGFSSPMSNMIRLGSDHLPMPVKSKKILNFEAAGNFTKKSPPEDPKGLSKKPTHNSDAMKNVNDRLQKFF